MGFEMPDVKRDLGAERGCGLELAVVVAQEDHPLHAQHRRCGALFGLARLA